MTSPTASNLPTKTSLGCKTSPLYEVFLEQLAVMKDAELQLTHALPLIAKVARSADLKALINVHIKETQGHVKSVEQIAVSLNEDLLSRE